MSPIVRFTTGFPALRLIAMVGQQAQTRLAQSLESFAHNSPVFKRAVVLPTAIAFLKYEKHVKNKALRYIYSATGVDGKVPVDRRYIDNYVFHKAIETEKGKPKTAMDEKEAVTLGSEILIEMFTWGLIIFALWYEHHRKHIKEDNKTEDELEFYESMEERIDAMLEKTGEDQHVLDEIEQRLIRMFSTLGYSTEAINALLEKYAEKPLIEEPHVPFDEEKMEEMEPGIDRKERDDWVPVPSKD